MEQRPKVVRDIVLTCVVLHNMLRSHQGGADRPPTSADNIVAPQAHQREQGHHENLRNPLREAKHQQDRLKDRLLQSLGGTGWPGGQSLRRLRGRTCCHLSVLFRTSQITQELLFSKVLPKK